MSKSCSIIPQILNKEGNLVDSNLFTDLLTETNNNRDLSKRYYVYAKNNIHDNLDENGEPKIKEVLNAINVADYTNSNPRYKNSSEVLADYKDQTNEGVLNTVIENTRNHELLKIAETLLKNVDKLKHVNFSVQEDKGHWLGRYYANDGNIELNVRQNLLNITTKENYAETVIHEYIHAFTLDALNNPKNDIDKKFAKEVNTAFEAFKRTSDIKQYGFTNQYEFVSELMSNPAFVNNLGAKNKSILDKFIQAIRILFGLDPNNKAVRNIITKTHEFIDNSTPEKLVGNLLKPLNKESDREGVIGELNHYLRQAKESRDYISELEKAILTIHKRIRYNVGKTNLEITNQTKGYRTLETQYNKDLRQVIQDYVDARQGVYDEGYKLSPPYKALTDKFDFDTLPLKDNVNQLIAYKDGLNKDLVDLKAVPDITVFELQYANVASQQMDEIETKTYDLNNPTDIQDMSNDYNFLHLFSKFTGMYNIKGKADILINRLTNDFVSPFISQTANANLNLEGLDIKSININDLLKNNPDVGDLEKYFRGLGDYPRLEAQLVHALTVEGSKKARFNSEKVGEEILHFKKKLIDWAKKNNIKGLTSNGKLTNVYSLMSDVNHLGRLDMVKPYTNSYYEKVNQSFKDAYKSGLDSKEPSVQGAKAWLKDNYYTKPLAGPYVNPKHTYIQSQPELKEFYDYFQKTVSDVYDKLPDYISLTNKEKIPSLIKDVSFDFLSLRPNNILKSIRLGIKTMLFGSGSPVFYNSNGELEDKFTIKELTQDQVRLKMIGEVESSKKSNDLGAVLFQFNSFGNEYEQMTKVLPIVRLIQNIVAKKTYGNDVSGVESKLNAAFNLYIDKTITKTANSDEHEFKLLGTAIFDNNGKQIGEQKYYWSTFVKHLLSYTRLLQLGFNPVSGVANLFAGISANITEAAGGQYYDRKSYFKALGLYLGDAFQQRTSWLHVDPNMTKTELLSEIIQPLDEIAEYETRREIKVNNSSVVKQAATYLYDKSFILQQLGEDVIHKSSMIAYMLNTKVDGTDGQKHALWDLFKVDKDKLVFNEELAGSNNIEDFLKDHKNRIITINSSNQGDYGKDNSSVHSNSIVYQVAILFRKWLPAMVANRFQKARYNYKTGVTEEGFFRTGSRAISKTFTNTYLSIHSMITQNQDELLNKKVLTKEELIASRKMTSDLLQILSLTLLPLLVMPPPRHKDKDDYTWYLPTKLQDWFYKHMNLGIYKSKEQFDNAKDPMAFFVKSMSDLANRTASDRLQFYNIFKYPDAITRMALVQTLKELGQAFYALGDLAFGDAHNQKITKGVNKGEYKALKEVRDIVPYWKQADKVEKTSKKKLQDLQK